MSTLAKLIRQSRSYRRFGPEGVSIGTLRELVDLARLSPSGANRQPLKFFLSADEATNAKVFPHTLWAGYLKDWPGPGKGERPTAYIVILCDKTISDTPGVDHGIAAQSIMLGAAERGLGGCIIGSIHREKLREALGLAEHLDILLVLALGKPVERVVIAQPGADGDIRYWRDEEHVHHVPKRSLDELIINP